MRVTGANSGGQWEQQLMKPERVSLSNVSQLPQSVSVYCNNEAGVNNSLICDHLGPSLRTHGETICRRQVRSTGDGGQVLGHGDTRHQLLNFCF